MQVDSNLFRLKEGWHFRQIGKGFTLRLWKPDSIHFALCGRKLHPGKTIQHATEDVLCKQCLANYLRIIGES